MSKEKADMAHRLLVTFMAEYTNESLEELQFKFEKWADSKTEEEMGLILGDGAEVKKRYRDPETGEDLHSEADIFRSMFEND